MDGVKDAPGGTVCRVIAAGATPMVTAPRLTSPGTRRSGLAPAFLAALAIHAAVLGLLLVAGRPARMPEIAEPAAVSVVFEPEALPQPAPAGLEAAAAPPIPPPQPDEAQAPDAPLPPALAQAEPIPDIQALTPPLPETATAPSVPAPPRPLEPPRLARSALHPVPPLPRLPKHLEQEPVTARVPVQSTSQVTAAAVPSAPAGASPQQPRSAQVISASSPSMGAWRSALIAWLERHKTYPEAARDEGAEGRVLVRFTVSRDGRVLDASLVQSSGSRALDAAALALLEQAHLPPFPAGVAQSTLTATLPLTYQLE